jgi:hypothetical protein
MTFSKAILIAGAMLALAGCSAIDRLTGGTDNTVLPGQREEAIPGRSQFPDKSEAGNTPAPAPAEETAPDAAQTGCQPDDPGCAPPSGDDTFSDPQ